MDSNSDEKITFDEFKKYFHKKVKYETPYMYITEIPKWTGSWNPFPIKKNLKRTPASNQNDNKKS